MKKRTIKYFDEWTCKTKQIMYEGYDKELVKIKIFMTLKYLSKGFRVLDAGCGIGNITNVLAGYCDNIVGVDFSSLNVKKAKDNLRSKRNAEVILADITALPLQDAKFDVIVSYSTLYYVEELNKALEEFHRILRNGGYAIFELGNKYSWNALQYRWQSGVILHLRSPDELVFFIKKSFFSVKERRIFQLFPIIHIFERIFCCRIGGRLIEEWISSTPILRNFSFRYLFVCKKENENIAVKQNTTS
ncbi:MAG: class I SAM-dependent methyltransferase [Candidatus Bathyarchaeia archaeon]